MKITYSDRAPTPEVTRIGESYATKSPEPYHTCDSCNYAKRGWCKMWETGKVPEDNCPAWGEKQE